MRQTEKQKVYKLNIIEEKEAKAENPCNMLQMHIKTSTAVRDVQDLVMIGTAYGSIGPCIQGCAATCVNVNRAAGSGCSMPSSKSRASAVNTAAAAGWRACAAQNNSRRDGSRDAKRA